MIGIPILAAIAIFRLFLFNVKGVRETYDTFKMSIPGLGKLVRQFSIAKFARTFAALYRAALRWDFAGDRGQRVRQRRHSQRRA